MDHGFGMESPSAHAAMPLRKPARYLVIIDEAGSTLARLFLDTHEQVGEIDAGAEEVALMARGLIPAKGALGPEWDRALRGHSDEERREADVYTLEVKAP